MILNNENLNLPPKIIRRQGCPPPSFLFSALLEILAGVIRYGKEKKTKFRKEEVNSLVTDGCLCRIF